MTCLQLEQWSLLTLTMPLLPKANLRGELRFLTQITPPYNFCVDSLSFWFLSDWELINNYLLLILHALQIMFPCPIAVTF